MGGWGRGQSASLYRARVGASVTYFGDGVKRGFTIGPRIRIFRVSAVALFGGFPMKTVTRMSLNAPRTPMGVSIACQVPTVRTEARSSRGMVPTRTSEAHVLVFLLLAGKLDRVGV